MTPLQAEVYEYICSSDRWMRRRYLLDRVWIAPGSVQDALGDLVDQYYVAYDIKRDAYRV